MAKDPAFLFYPGDWSLGTMHMTILEKGAYIELLMLQFAREKFTEAHAKHMLNGSFGVVWDNIKEKFETDGKLFWNKRLMEEKERRKTFTESRRINGLSSKHEPKNTKAHAKHMHKHMEDENENENKDINAKKNELIYPFDSENFQKIWNVLIKEKKWKNKSFASLQSALKKLSLVSESDAIQMMENTITGNWQGLFELKNNSNNGKSREQKSNIEIFTEAINSDIGQSIRFK